MRATHAALAGTLAFLGLTALVVGQNRTAGPDWPQWRGPNRDGSLPTFTAPPTWPEALTRRWKVEVGTGYATPIVVANRVYAFSRQDEDEVMRALDAETGKTIWETRYATQFKMNPATARHGPGPKSTPTFADGRLFTLGMTGIVTAFDAATGKQIWQKPAPPVEPHFHTSQSALVDRGHVILHVGGHDQGALTAFDAATGAVKWSWNGDGPAYGSPILADFGGTRQVDQLLAEEPRRRGRGNRTAFVAGAVRSTVDYELHHAARLRPDGDRLRPGQAADRLQDLETERSVERRDGLGERPAADVVQQSGARP